jgi:hypothetical protein
MSEGNIQVVRGALAAIAEGDRHIALGFFEPG